MAEPIEIVTENDIFYYKQGNIKFPIDKDSEVKSVAMLDKLGDSVWMSLAGLNHLPFNPFNKRLLKPCLMGIINLAWQRRWKEGDTASIQKLEHNQEMRVEKYKKELALAGDKDTAKKAKAAKTKAAKPKKEAGPREHRKYVIAKGVKLADHKGQLKLILEAMTDLDKPVTVEDIVKKIEDKLITRQPADRVVKYYMAAGQTSGVIVAAKE